jgi:hypothetical protein
MWYDICIDHILYKLEINITLLYVDQERRVCKIFPLTFGCDIENYKKGHSPTYHSLMSILFCIQTLMASSL